MFKDADASVYVPVFKDGWSPPDIIVDDRNAAAAKSAAAMVARMKVLALKCFIKIAPLQQSLVESQDLSLWYKTI